MAETAEPQSLYGDAFYESHREGTARSAAVVVPFLVDLLKPQSVVDVGCGAGLWLAAFQAEGVGDVVGIDGPWVAPEHRAALGPAFIERDLTQPIELGRGFDLALCLEVAEHLPIEAAERLVADLTRLAPVVVFSAAIPFQGGDGHVSERWADHWSALFGARGFERAADLRWRFWSDDRIAFWYRQNTLCYVDRARADLIERLRGAERDWLGAVKNVVHPELYLRYCRALEETKRHGEELETWLARANAEIANVRGEIERLRADLHGAKAELGDTRWKLERAREELGEIKSSRSWRLIQRLMPVVHAARRVKSFLGFRGRVGGAGE